MTLGDKDDCSEFSTSCIQWLIDSTLNGSLYCCVRFRAFICWCNSCTREDTKRKSKEIQLIKILNLE